MPNTKKIPTCEEDFAPRKKLCVKKKRRREEMRPRKKTAMERTKKHNTGLEGRRNMNQRLDRKRLAEKKENKLQ